MSGNKQAPLPRDQDQVSFTEMVPFRSAKIRLWRSPIFWFVAATAVLNVLLFTQADIFNAATRGSVQEKVAAFMLFEKVALFYILALSFIGVYSYAKTDKPIYAFLFAAVFAYAFLEIPNLFHYYAQPFVALSGEPGSMHATSWLTRLWGAFAGPGLREELLKAMPALIGAALMVYAAKATSVPPVIARLLRVRGPLDGVLMGFAAGCGFLFSETSSEYVPGWVQKSFTASQGNLAGAFGDGLALLLPRALNGWVGHMAWAGIFGYFVGLAVLRRKAAPKLLLGGWVVAALLHGLWDSDAPGEQYALYAIGGAGGLLAIACLVKARQLESSIFGRSNESFGSIVVPAGYAPAAAPLAAPQPIAPPVAAYSPPRPAVPPPVAATPAYVPPPAAPAFAQPVPVPAPAPAPQQAPAPASALALALPTRTLPLTVGQTLEIDEPGLTVTSQGIRAEVTQHPTNATVTGLKNVGRGTWYARLRDNSIQPIETQRSLRLAEGVSIDFGSGLVGKVVAT